MNKETMVYPHNGIPLSDKKRNELPMCGTMWMDLKCIMLRKGTRSKRKHVANALFHLHDIQEKAEL